jgi:hypothetical protein
MENTITLNTDKLKSICIGNASVNYSDYSGLWGVSYCRVLKKNETLPFEFKDFLTLQEAIQYAESQC